MFRPLQTTNVVSRSTKGSAETSSWAEFAARRPRFTYGCPVRRQRAAGSVPASLEAPTPNAKEPPITNAASGGASSLRAVCSPFRVTRWPRESVFSSSLAKFASADAVTIGQSTRSSCP